MYENFERVSVSKNGTHFLARCLLCGDSKKSKSKKRFNLDFAGGNPIYHCFNCSKSGSFLQLYSYVKGLTIEESKKELYKFDPDRLTQQLSKRRTEKIIKHIGYEDHNWILEDCVSGSVPMGILDRSYFAALKKFRIDRKIDSTYKLYIAYKGEYKNRIIIPIYDENNDIIYFQARRFPGSGVIPKYKNPHIEKGSILLNKSNFDKEKYIIVVEGLIDAFMIGKQGTSCLGVEINNKFMKEIIDLGKVIISFDNDKAGYNSLIQFMKGKGKPGRKKALPPNKYAKKVRYFLYPDKYAGCKDINKIVVDFDVSDVYDMILSHSYSYSTAYTILHTDRVLKKKLFQN
jgi:hypothetical protein